MSARSRKRSRSPVAPADASPPPTTSYGPADWQRSWSRLADLGFPDYAPPRSGHDEDEMSEILVKNGYKARSLLNDSARQLETFDAHNLIHDGFAKHGYIHLHMLGQLMLDVTGRQAESHPQVGPSTYRLPPKITVHDSKRNAWIADLANPDIPLSKLSTGSIPNTFKGHDLLDMLHKHSIPIDRAVWYVRVLGAHETHVMRSRPNFNSTQYSIDWTNIVVTHLKKQLGEIMLPTPYRPGLTIRQPFQGVLGDPESRDRWISRFSYSLALLREFVSEGLVDQPTFMSWLAAILLSCNLAQLEFVIQIVEEHFETLLENRAYLAPFLEACLTRLNERALLIRPESLIHPRLWMIHGTLLRSILVENPEPSAVVIAELPENVPDVCASLRREYDDVAARVDALLFRTLPPREAKNLRSTLADIKLLNTIGPSTHLSDLDYFPTASSASTSTSSQEAAATALSSLSLDRDTFRTKLHTLLTWASTSQCGPHKRYAAASLIMLWQDRQESDPASALGASAASRLQQPNQSPTSGIPPPSLIQTELLEWLDTSEVARDRERNGAGVALLFGELVRAGLFDISHLVKRVWVRRIGVGASRAPPVSEVVAENRQEYLKIIPIPEAKDSVRADKLFALYGSADSTQQEERDKIEELQIKLVLAVPDLFPDLEVGEQEITISEDGAVVSPAQPHLLPFANAEVAYNFLMPAVWAYISSRPSSDPIEPHVFCYVARTLASCACHHIIKELCLHLLKMNPNPELVQAALDTLRAHLDIWAAMDATDDIVETLQGYLATQDSPSEQSSRHLTQFIRDISSLRQIGDVNSLDEDDLNLPTSKGNEKTAVLVPEILELIRSPLLNADMSTTLRNRYDPTTKWTSSLWESTLSTIYRLSFGTYPPEGDQDVVMRLAKVLEESGNALSLELDIETRAWFHGRGHRLLSTFDERMWSATELLLSHLVDRCVISSVTVLQGLVFPTWATVLDDSVAPLLVPLQHTINLAQRLLVVNLTLPITIQEEDQARIVEGHHLRGQLGMIHTRRDAVKVFQALASLVALEHRKGISDEMKDAARGVRVHVSNRTTFRRLAARFIEDARNVFCHSPEEISCTGSPLEDGLLETLEMLIMPTATERGDEMPTSPQLDLFDIGSILSLMNPWSIPTAMMELQLSFKRLTIAMTDGNQREEAMNAMSTFFQHSLAPEQTDLVAGVLQGMQGVLAERFFESGLERLALLLGELLEAVEVHQIDDFLRSAGEVLRLLAAVLLPLREKDKTPAISPTTHRTVVTRLCDCFQACITSLMRMPHDARTPPLLAVHRWFERIMLLLRLTQFHVSFRAEDTSFIIDIMAVLLSLLSAFYAQSRLILDTTVVAATLDTLAYALSDGSRVTSTGVVQCPASPREAPELLDRLPVDVAARIRFLILFKPKDPRVAGLYMAKRVPNTSRLVLGEPLQGRPWEWMPYNAPPAPTDLPPRSDSPPPLTNNTSISLDQFILRAPFEASRPLVALNETRVDVALRKNRDRFYGETMYERDWRDGRTTSTSQLLDQTPEPEDGVEDGEEEGFSAVGSVGDAPHRMYALNDEMTLSGAEGKMTPSGSAGSASASGLFGSSPSSLGRSSAPGSPLSASATASTSSSSGAAGRGGAAAKANAHAQGSSRLRNEVRMSSSSDSLSSKTRAMMTATGMPALPGTTVTASSSSGRTRGTAATAAGTQPQAQPQTQLRLKRKATTELDVVVAASTSPSVASSSRAQKRPVLPASNSSATNTRSAAAAAAGLPRLPGTAPAAARPVLPTSTAAPGLPGRHPLPAKPQFANAAAGVVGASANDAKRKRGTTGVSGLGVGTGVMSPDGSGEQKKRRV
ncbi:hypothetical protein DL93DRAFT_2173589 [Clavulina sp. PMI_390]|nr:hypothetical protein DL93DRAFT_2173589 [Clavulina sp. PMI_390]